MLEPPPHGEWEHKQKGDEKYRDGLHGVQSPIERWFIGPWRLTLWLLGCSFPKFPLMYANRSSGHSSEDIHGRYVYLELAVQAKAIVSLPSYSESIL
jgi:hypothetical protein